MIQLFFLLQIFFLETKTTDNKVNEFLKANSSFIEISQIKKDQHWAAMGRLRFTADKTTEVGLNYTENKNVDIQLYSFQYTNEQKAKSAFGNLMACFPKKCVEIKWNESKNGEFLPAIYIIDENEIFSLKVNCANNDSNWEDLKKLAKSFFGTESSIIAETNCDKLTWTVNRSK